MKIALNAHMQAQRFLVLSALLAISLDIMMKGAFEIARLTAIYIMIMQEQYLSLNALIRLPALVLDKK